MGIIYSNRVVFVCDECDEEFETTGTSYLTPPDWISLNSELWFCTKAHIVEYLTK